MAQRPEPRHRKPALQSASDPHARTHAPKGEHSVPLGQSASTPQPLQTPPGAARLQEPLAPPQSPSSRHWTGPGREGPASENTPASSRPASWRPASWRPASSKPESARPASLDPASELPASELPASRLPASRPPASRDPPSSGGASPPQAVWKARRRQRLQRRIRGSYHAAVAQSSRASSVFWLSRRMWRSSARVLSISARLASSSAIISPVRCTTISSCFERPSPRSP